MLLNMLTYCGAKMKIKYFVLPKSITVLIDGKNYHINSDNQRYKDAVSLIKEGKIEDLAKVVDPFYGIPDFTLEDGLVKYKNEFLPSILGDQFLKFKMESVSFLSLANFWLNLKNRLDFEKAKLKVIDMLTFNGYPLTKDGFIIVYLGTDKRWYEPSLNNDKSIPFYSCGSVDPYLYEYFKQKKDIQDIITSEFGFFSKKLNKLVLDRLFKNDYLKLDGSVFRYSLIFKGILSNENLVKLIESNSCKWNSLDKDNCDKLNEILKTFSEKKVLNLIKRDGESLIISQLISSYFHLKKRNEESLIKLSEFPSIKDMNDYIRQEIKKLDIPPNFDLDVLSSFPNLKDVKSFLINSEMKIIYPLNSHELYEWSDKMSNCIKSYGELVKEGKSLVLAVVGKKEMLYNIEIVDFKVRQLVSKRNGLVNVNDQSLIMKFLLDNNLIK